MEKGSACALPDTLIWFLTIQRKLLQEGQSDHAAHRVADQAGEGLDLQMIEHGFCRFGAVFDAQVRELQGDMAFESPG